MTKANYDNPQSKLLDTVGDKLRAKNDSHLALLLKTHPPLISRVRSQTSGLSSAMIIRIHDMTGMSVRDIKTLAGLKCAASMRQVSQ